MSHLFDVRSGLFSALLVTSMMVSSATFAQDAAATQADAAAAPPSSDPIVSCSPIEDRLESAALDAFVLDPANLLATNEFGGLPLANTTRNLLTTSSAMLPPVLSLVEKADPRQLSALAAGLARATFACVEEQPEYAQRIQESVAELGNEALLETYALALSDVQTAAIAAGGGVAAAPSVSGAAADGAGTAGAGGDEAIRTTSGVYDFVQNSLLQSYETGSDVSPSSVTN